MRIDIKLAELKQVYFLGIGGIGMSALARWFLQNGFPVAGYDKTESQDFYSGDYQELLSPMKKGVPSSARMELPGATKTFAPIRTSPINREKECT